MTIDTDQLRQIGENLSRMHPADETGDEVGSAADEIDQLRALLAEARMFVEFLSTSDYSASAVQLLPQIDAALGEDR